MKKIFFKLNSLILAIFLIFSNFAYASSSGNIVSSYVVNKNLTSLDLSFVSDVLRLNLKQIPQFLKAEILNLQSYEKNNIDLVRTGNYNSNLLLGGSSGGGGSSRTFYNNEYHQISEFKDLVKNYNVRKSLNSDNLKKFIDKGLIYNNDEFNKLFKKWNNKILNYYSVDESFNLSNYEKFTIKDITFWYLKEDIEYFNLPKSFDITKITSERQGIDIGDLEFPINGDHAAYSKRVIIKSKEYEYNWYHPEDLLKFEEPWHIQSAWQISENAYLNFDDFFNLIKTGQKSYIKGTQFMMFGSSDLNNPNENFSKNNIIMQHFHDGSEWSTLNIKYHKFLIKLPDNTFKISYIVDFDGNRELNPGDFMLSEKSRFSGYFPKIVHLKSDELYRYFKYTDFYDYDLSNDKKINININDIFIPYNVNNVDNKQLLDKLNNIDDFLYFLLSNLNYSKQFNNLNKRLDNYDALFLNFDNKLNYIIDKLNNQKLFDYNKLNEIVKNNLEEFNKKYIEGLSEDLKYITNLVKENKIEILKNNDKIVDIYNKVNEIDKNIDSINTRFNKYDEDLEYIKANLKSVGQNEKDNNFKNQFNDPEKNRVADSLNFFDKFINFFKDFFNVTESFDFKKIDTSSLYKKIPFSIFYDISIILKKLTVPPKVPKFDIPIYTETIVVDFDKFESLAVIVRSFILLYVVIFLAMKIYNKVG